MGVPLQKRRFTVADFYRMAEVGILGRDERVELIEGEVVQMPPIGSGHGGSVNYLANELKRLVGDGAVIAVQNPLRISDLSEPIPDVCVLRPRPDFYRPAHPTPADTLLVIEVAARSAAADREVKGPLYAMAGVPEFWLVDLNRGAVEIYRAPGGHGWQERRITRAGERIAPAAFPAALLEVTLMVG